MRGYNVEEVTNLSGWPQYTHLPNEKGLDWIVSIISKISYPQTLSLKSNYPFPFITEIKYAGKSHSVVSDSLQPHGLIHGILILILIHGILQARILEWVTIPFSRGSSQPRDRTQDSFIAGGFFTNWVTRETQEYWNGWPIPSPGDLPDQELNWGLLHCRRILFQLSYQGSPVCIYMYIHTYHTHPFSLLLFLHMDPHLNFP